MRVGNGGRVKVGDGGMVRVWSWEGVVSESGMVRVGDSEVSDGGRVRL